MGHRYRQMDIATSTPEGLVAKLFEAAVRHTRRARELTASGPVPERCRALSKAIAIVGELRSSLDPEQGGEIARNLEGLYDFVVDRLLLANQRGAAEPIDDALRVLDPLAEAWAELARGGSVAVTKAAPLEPAARTAP